MIATKLIRRSWLRRTFVVTLPDGSHVVEYDGRGLGYEQVSVDGEAIQKIGWTWFVPRFEFEVGGLPGVVEVRVWPWLAIRSLVLRVGDRVAHAEGIGVGKPKAGAPGDRDELA